MIAAFTPQVLSFDGVDLDDDVPYCAMRQQQVASADLDTHYATTCQRVLGQLAPLCQLLLDPSGRSSPYRRRGIIIAYRSGYG